MAAPCSVKGLEIEFSGRLVSLPYLEMTRRVMAAFGAACDAIDERTWRIPPGGYAACDYHIEPDASAASYFFAAAAITGGDVTVEGLSRQSMQGDVAFCDVLQRMGCEVVWDERGSGSTTVRGRAARGIDIDMNAISDTVPTLAVAALFADGPTTIRNVAHIRDKETDRIGDLARELRRLGADVDDAGELCAALGGPHRGGRELGGVSGAQAERHTEVSADAQDRAEVVRVLHVLQQHEHGAQSKDCARDPR
jgi:3-phosphoshikimate 1-carboxyvinyltransferase